MNVAAVPLGRGWYERPPELVARSLLGCLLIAVRDGVAAGGRIVETEAYAGADDPASHAARLRTGGVGVMSGPPGIAYVYRSYGLHAMLNAAAHRPGETGAVLIRAIEPLWGIETMRRRRGRHDPLLLCAGPGRLCQALAIGLDDHGHDLTSGPPLWIALGEPAERVEVSGRIGVSRGAEALLRFFETGSRFVSAHRQGRTPHPATTD